MPIYEYACEKCESEFEREQRITDAPIKSCPRCKSRRVKRLISRTSFVLKGSGWYSDLYSSSAAKDAKDGKDGKDSKADSGDGKAASDSTDPKSETKSESKSADTAKGKDKPSAKPKSKTKGGKAASR